MYTLQTLVLHRQIPQERRESADHAWRSMWVPTDASMLHNLKKSYPDLVSLASDRSFSGTNNRTERQRTAGSKCHGWAAGLGSEVNIIGWYVM